MQLKLSDRTKIKIMTSMLEHIEDSMEKDSPTFKMVGILTKGISAGGCQTLPIGSPVYETSDQYFLLFTTLDGKKNVEVYYWKEAGIPELVPFLLKHCIDFSGKCVV